MITNKGLPDMQQEKNGFINRRIEKVGVRGIKLPIKIKMKCGSSQDVIANFSSYCNLVSSIKGINMSRITRTLTENLEYSDDGFVDMSLFLHKLREAHGTDDIYIKSKFKYIINNQSPMSKQQSFEPVDVTFESTISNNIESRYLTVVYTGMSLCPCSKEMSLLKNNITEDEMIYIKSLPDHLSEKILMSGFGAHNQNSIVKVKVKLNENNKMWIEDIVDIINMSISAPVFNILKREDEKYVTEVSYLGGYFNDDKQFIDVGFGGAKFVEDIIRDCSNLLDKQLDVLIDDFVVVVNNAESIHPEDIYATAITSAGRELK